MYMMNINEKKDVNYHMKLPRIAQYLKYCSKMCKLKVNIIQLLVGVKGHLNV